MKNSLVLIIAAITAFLVCGCPPNIKCPDGQSECDQDCVDLQTDEHHCGNCQTECLIDQVCESGKCVEDCGTTGAECSDNEPCCDSLICISGTCEDCVAEDGECSDHSDCCGDLACDLSGHCVDLCVEEDGACTDGSECCEPLVCIDDTCQPCVESTGECYTTEDCCAELVCYQGVCGPECGLENDACSPTEPCCHPWECRNNTCQAMQITWECTWDSLANPSTGLAAIPGANSTNLGDFEVHRHHGSHATVDVLMGLIFYKTIDLATGAVGEPAGTSEWSEDGTSICGGIHAWEQADGCGLTAEIEGTQRTATVTDCDFPKLSSDDKLLFGRQVDSTWYVFSVDLTPGSGTDLGVGTPQELTSSAGSSIYLEGVSADGSAVLAAGSGKAYLSKNGASFVEIADSGYGEMDINGNGEVVTTDDGPDIDAVVLIDEGGSPIWTEIMLNVSLWGQQASGNPGYKNPSVDELGRFVAFSGSSWVELGTTPYGNLTSQIFVIDLWTGIVELVSKVNDTAVTSDCTNPKISPTGESILFKSDAPELPGADGDFWIFRVDNPLYSERTMTGSQCKPVERSCDEDALNFCPAGDPLVADCLAGCYAGPGVARCATFAERIWRQYQELSADTAEVYALLAVTPGEYIIEVTPDDLPDLGLYACPADGTDCSFGGTNLGEVNDAGAGETEFFQITFDEPTEFLLVVESMNATAGHFDLLIEPPRSCETGEGACEGDDLGICNAEGNGSTGVVEAVCALPCQAIEFYIGAACGYLEEEPEPGVPTDAQDLGSLPVDMRTVVEGQLEDAGDDVDWYVFSLTDTALVKISNVEPYAGGAPFDSYLALYDGGQDPGDLLFEADLIGLNIDFIPETSLPAGSYYVEITPSPNFPDVRGSYRLQFDVASP
jgi:hypothetical protein